METETLSDTIRRAWEEIPYYSRECLHYLVEGHRAVSARRPSDEAPCAHALLNQVAELRRSLSQVPSETGSCPEEAEALTALDRELALIERDLAAALRMMERRTKESRTRLAVLRDRVRSGWTGALSLF